MTGLAVALAAALGAHLLFNVPAGRRRPAGTRPAGRGALVRRPRRLGGPAEWLAQAGIETSPSRLAVLLGGSGIAGGFVGFEAFGGALPSAAAALAGVLLPVASLRARRSRRLEEARQAWPRMIEEVRLQTTGLGRSIPQALFVVGRRGPVEMRPCFEAAEREWLVSTDFRRTVAVLKERLADPTADAVCETLLVAHELGGAGVEARLRALVDDRLQELDGRRDAIARQAGARFARRFVLLVPVGMAVAGASIGDGRAAYDTPAGQVAVAAGVAAILACWLWAGRLMRLPDHERVFRE